MPKKTYRLKANVTSISLTYPDGRSRLLTEGNTVESANQDEQRFLDEHPGLTDDKGKD